MTRRPLRVLDLRDTDEIGGPGKTLLETFRTIDHQRFQMAVAVFRRHDEVGETPFMAAARRIGMPVHEIRTGHQYDPRLIVRTAALVRRLQADIVHSHEVKSDVLTYLGRSLHRAATVTTLHGWIGNSAKQRALIAMDRRLVRHFSRVIAVSGRIREQLLEAGVPAAKLRLIHNGIVLDNYRRTGTTGHLASLVGRPLNGPVIVSIGRLSREKGHADLIEALAMVAARSTAAWEMVVVGDGPERTSLTERIAQLGLRERVHLVGYVDGARTILEDASLSVLPSHTEGLPNAALEALAMGVPVLATRVGGTPEVLDDRVTGVMVPAHQPAALADGILDFLQHRDEWQAMASRGGTMVRERFDFLARTRRLEALYDELWAERQ